MKIHFKKLEQLLRKMEDYFLLLLFLGVLFTAVGQIVLRNFFSTSLFWTDASLKMAVLWITLLGSIVAARENRHLSIDVFSKFLPTKIKKVVDVIIQTFSLVICLILAKYSKDFVLLTYEFQDLFLGRFPLWWFQVILPAGFLLMAVRFGLNVYTVQTNNDYITGKDDGELIGDVQ